MTSDEARRQYLELREASGLPAEEFDRRAHVIVSQGHAVTHQAWLRAAQTVSAWHKFPNWPQNIGRPCCGLAEIRPCVCVVSIECPAHGRRCYGSHE